MKVPATCYLRFNIVSMTEFCDSNQMKNPKQKKNPKKQKVIVWDRQNNCKIHQNIDVQLEWSKIGEQHFLLLLPSHLEYF